MANQYCIHATVKGTVQGVFFRQSTRDKALEYGLTGWVRNLANGDVELVACGDKNKIRLLEAWLHQGPAGAKVSVVLIEERKTEDFDHFEITK